MTRENLMLLPEYDADMRRAMVCAKLSMRHYKRELGGYAAKDLDHNIKSAAHLAEALRLRGAGLSEGERTALHEHLLLKILQIGLGVKLLGTAAATDPGSSQSPLAQYQVRAPIRGLMGSCSSEA